MSRTRKHEAFHEPQPSAVHQRRREPLLAAKLVQDCLHPFACQNKRQPLPFPGANHLTEGTDLPPRHMAVEEEEAARA
ncbi:MAG: hypothetical protein KatS3mg077_1154 [Candidatus Binatia bacterium]|nr:MAG: hypothetical protein KatS3mg077_1154 [Candidatus Binatia bacterium]